jgi:predicted  nucleic acid-binding Zn-ribbon protein
VSKGLMNLANYIITLKEDGKYSTDIASQKTLGCF